MKEDIKEKQISKTKIGSFGLLTIREEELLSLEEKKEYYKALKEWIIRRPLKHTTKGATTIAPKLKKATNGLAKLMCHLFAKGASICVDGQENIPKGTVLFAHSHQGILDNFVWIPEVEQHCILLHGAEVNKLLLAAQLNTGLILVVKGDKENNLNVKLDMMRLLHEGHSITYFPEGTWNLSPNKLHLPHSYGFLDIAKKTGVPVVPVVHEYSYNTATEKERITKIHSRYGNPIYVGIEDDLNLKLQEYEEAISTMRWELIEEKGVTKRKEISNGDYINYLKGNYANLKLGKLNWEKECRYIFKGDDDFYVFHHVNDVPFDEIGRLL